jgi:hypothetical protein
LKVLLELKKLELIRLWLLIWEADSSGIDGMTRATNNCIDANDTAINQTSMIVNLPFLWVTLFLRGHLMA